eukprot:scaffold4278_cov263-Pinguiococcus_pyrenoidosus.AAC.16
MKAKNRDEDGVAQAASISKEARNGSRSGASHPCKQNSQRDAANKDVKVAHRIELEQDHEDIRAASAAPAPMALEPTEGRT